MPSSKASVIIDTYNHRKYMKNCLSSVLANDPLEVIVVDNNSEMELLNSSKKIFLRSS